MMLSFLKLIQDHLSFLKDDSFKLLSAASASRWDELCALLKKPNVFLNLNYQSAPFSRTALMYACKNNWLPGVQKLIEAGAELNYQNKFHSALHHAVIGLHFECVQTLIHHGADVDLVNQRGYTPLMELLFHPPPMEDQDRVLNMIQLLLNAGANPHFKALDGATPFTMVCLNNFEKAAELFIHEGVDVNFSDEQGQTLLMCMASSGQASMLNLLIEHGADPNAVDHQQWNALFYACHFGHDHCVRVLIDRGSSLDHANLFGNTALMYACSSSRSKECAQLLLEAGARVDVLNHAGESALSISFSKNPVDCAPLIQAYSDFQTFQPGLVEESCSTPVRL